jgi:predicted dehydrogenase
MTHVISIFDPGHFHAALLFFDHNPRVDPVLRVYAPPGPNVESFIALIEGFNSRQDRPTAWKLDCHIGADAMERLVADRPGDIVILAGRNGPRLALMHRLHDEGFHVFADKPWLTDSAALPHLDAITAGAPLAVDIMPGRHSVAADLRNAIIGTPSVFGALAGDTDRPALEFSSRHHLLKQVDGKPLKRPAWFYDSAMQGDGMVDIHSHYVDQTQWIIGDGRHFDIDRDVEILDAERWTVPVPLELFRESTGEPAFPAYLADAVDGEVLNLACNGRMDYRLRGIAVRQHCDWGSREPEGGTDLHGFTARGEKAELSIRVGPETGFTSEIVLRPEDETALGPALERWSTVVPGLEMKKRDDGYLLVPPASASVRHEAQFPLALDRFLDLAEQDFWPDEIMARIRTRYTLLARARDLALAP